MKSSGYLLRIGVILFFTFAFTSCISISRNIVINKDGSGIENIKVTFSKEFYSVVSSFASFMDSSRQQEFLDSLYSDQLYINETRKQYDSIPGVSLIDLSSERNADSSNSIIIKYDFDSISKIGASLNSLNGEDKSSETSVSWTRNGDRISFMYSFEEVNPVMPENDSLGDEMKQGMAEMFEDKMIRFQIEFPYEVISSNASFSDGNKLTWNISLSDVFLSRKMILEAEMKAD